MFKRIFKCQVGPIPWEAEADKHWQLWSKIKKGGTKMNVTDAILKRRSIRNFKPDPVEKEKGDVLN
jgi:hypothetical protein